jgi:uncharacterized protein YkwD
MLACAAALAGQARAAGVALVGAERQPSLDQAILDRLNAVRAAKGLRPLRASDDLEKAAVFHSQTMLTDGFFAHDDPGGPTFVQRLKRFYSPAGYRSWTAGENLLYNSEQIDAGVAIQAWLDSPPHRENMLDPAWREVGIASMHAASAGGEFGGDAAWVITMDFGTRIGGVSAHATAAAKPAVRAAAKAAKQKRAVTKKPKVAPAKQRTLAERRAAAKRRAGAENDKALAARKALARKKALAKKRALAARRREAAEQKALAAQQAQNAGPGQQDDQAGVATSPPAGGSTGVGTDPGTTDPGAGDPGTSDETPPDDGFGGLG